MSILRERYQADLRRDGFVADAAQAVAVDAFEALLERLVAANVADSSWLRMMGHRAGLSKRTYVQGLYLFGGVGRGKTYLMDLFYDCVPFTAKWRSHFHRFMRAIHEQRSRLGNQADPLRSIARDLARQYRLICFDEFLVNDIADAMILGRLFEHLFDFGVTLVATSNVMPNDLYRDGFQRERFLPTIALLKAHLSILNVDSGIDYRLRALENAKIYYVPADLVAEQALSRLFDSIVAGGASSFTLEIDGRPLLARRHADGVVWFDFSALCAGPRGAADYIELARCYHTVLLSNVPLLTSDQDDQARRFITLVDEFYDRNVSLIISAQVELDDLYAGKRLTFEFARTRSRLAEMQSHEYLARPHLG